MRVLALSGSLRAKSLNSALLRAAARVAPAAMTVSVFGGLGDLPLFNPDLEAADPAPVARLRRDLMSTDAVVIASPEYAHGVSGVMKNALDWMVGNETFVDKPVALFNVSPRAVHAPASLTEILTTMSARVVSEACVAVPLLGSGLDEEGMVRDGVIRERIVAALRALQSTSSAPARRDR